MSLKIFKPKAEKLAEGKCPVCYAPLTTLIEEKIVPEQCPYGHGLRGSLEALCGVGEGQMKEIQDSSEVGLMDENGNDLY